MALYWHVHRYASYLFGIRIGYHGHFPSTPVILRNNVKEINCCSWWIAFIKFRKNVQMLQIIYMRKQVNVKLLIQGAVNKLMQTLILLVPGFRSKWYVLSNKYMAAVLEITVGHLTLSEQILKMSGQFHIVIGHDGRTCHEHILSSLLQGVVSQ